MFEHKPISKTPLKEELHSSKEINNLYLLVVYSQVLEIRGYSSGMPTYIDEINNIDNFFENKATSPF